MGQTFYNKTSRLQCNVLHAREQVFAPAPHTACNRLARELPCHCARIVVAGVAGSCSPLIFRLVGGFDLERWCMNANDGCIIRLDLLNANLCDWTVAIYVNTQKFCGLHPTSVGGDDLGSSYVDCLLIHHT